MAGERVNKVETMKCPCKWTLPTTWPTSSGWEKATLSLQTCVCLCVCVWATTILTCRASCFKGLFLFRDLGIGMEMEKRKKKLWEKIRVECETASNTNTHQDHVCKNKMDGCLISFGWVLISLCFWLIIEVWWVVKWTKLRRIPQPHFGVVDNKYSSKVGNGRGKRIYIHGGCGVTAHGFPFLTFIINYTNNNINTTSLPPLLLLLPFTIYKHHPLSLLASPLHCPCLFSLCFALLVL